MVRTLLRCCIAAAAICVTPAAAQTESPPDLSGVWRFGIHPGYILNIAADLGAGDVLPWAEAVFRARAREFGATDPAKAECLPFGPRHIIGGAAVERVRIVQTAALVLFLYEDLAYRQVFLEADTGTLSPVPSFMGHSVGRWEGDTLVVRTTGFNDRTWLDYTGHPHTEALEMVERYRATGRDRLEREVIITDRNTFTRPITIGGELRRVTDVPATLEYVCADNVRPLPRAFASQRTPAIEVSARALASYVGEYVAGSGAYTVSIRSNGQELIADVNGKGGVPLTALTATTFSASMLGTYEFRKDTAGHVTELAIHSIEGVTRAPRTPADAR